jgi:hypothetical protein
VEADANAGLLLAQVAFAGRERFFEGLDATARSSPSPRSVIITTTPFVEVAAQEFHGTPGRGVPAGVVQQFPHDTRRSARRPRSPQLFGRSCRRSRPAGRRAGLVDRVAKQRREVDLGEVQLERAALELGDRDDLVDDAISLSSEAWSWDEELGALVSGTDGVRST